MLSEKIAQLRKNKKVSQEELADVLMTSRQAVSKWERGESYPDIDRLKDLAIYFNVSIDYLLDYDLEAVSVNGFIKRLGDCIEKEDFSITEDEISTVVSKNKNNFDLLVSAIRYLADYWAGHRTDNVVDLLVDYCNKAMLIFKPDNPYKVTIKDLQNIIVDTYILKEQYDLARTYIKDNHVDDVETLLGSCEIELGHYDEAVEIFSTNHLSSCVKLIDGNMHQILLLMLKRKNQEAYELSNWLISFVKSIGKNDAFFRDVIFMTYFVRASCEMEIGLDYSESLSYLNENKDKVGDGSEDSDNMKFYYSKKVSFVSLTGDVKASLKKKIKQYSRIGDANKAISLYKEIFGED